MDQPSARAGCARAGTPTPHIVGCSGRRARSRERRMRCARAAAATSTSLPASRLRRRSAAKRTCSNCCRRTRPCPLYPGKPTSPAWRVMSAKGTGTEVRQPHSITSSARASSAGETVRPSAFAVFRLITNSYLVGACTGRSAGFSPFRMRSAYVAASRNISRCSLP
jgi:hypothetical protein